MAMNAIALGGAGERHERWLLRGNVLKKLQITEERFGVQVEQNIGTQDNPTRPRPTIPVANTPCFPINESIAGNRET
jgi:hypothetical protein